jgi:putative salt-induced outer membrane protein YdiY
MRLNTSLVIVFLMWCTATNGVAAQSQEDVGEPTPPWEVKLGASFVGTSGNSDTASTGATVDARRQWELWRIETAASAVRTSEDGTQTAEQYVGALRLKRQFAPRLSATTGLKLERDRLAGLNLRSALEGGLAYGLVKRQGWVVDGLTAIAWSHEDRVTGEVLDEAQADLEVTSKCVMGAAGETSQRFTFYPNLTSGTAYRSEAELIAQANMNRRLALKVAFLWRYAHDPVPGFQRSDTTTTASIVVRWRGHVSAEP